MQYRKIDNIFYCLRNRKLMAVLLVDRGYGSVPCLMAADIDMESVDFCLFQNPGHFKSFFQGASAFESMTGSELDENRESGARALTDCFNTFQGESHSVPQTAAVFIRAGIPQRGLKLIQKIPSGGEQFNRIRACHSCEACGIADLSDQASDIPCRNRLTG